MSSTPNPAPRTVVHKYGVKRQGPQPYVGFNDAVSRTEKTLTYLEAIERRVSQHRVGMRPKFVRALDLEVDVVLERLTVTINQARREIADKLPAE